MTANNAAITHCFTPEEITCGCSSETMLSCARVHLPVASGVNAMLAFGGATPSALKKHSLNPADALNALQQAMDKAKFKGNSINMVGVSGPGDPLATPEPLFELFKEIRQLYPDISLCLGTNGLGGAQHAPALAELGVTHVSLTVNMVDPEIAPKLYNWVRPGKQTIQRSQAGALLVQEQADALAAFVANGIAVTIRTVVYPGINDEHVVDIALFGAAGGASAMLLCPWLPPERCGDENAPAPELPAAPAELIQRLQLAAAEHLPVIDAADVCAAPAAGLGIETSSQQPLGITALPKPSPERPNVAVATSDGFDVDMHLGQTRQFLIYGPKEGLVSLLGSRKAPDAGKGDERWVALAEVLNDCSYVLVHSAGNNPERVLGEQGLRLLRTDGNIEPLVDTLYGGGKKDKCRK